MTWNRFEGWPLLGLTSSALVAMTLLLLSLHGLTEEAVRVIIRATARTSVVFFCAAIAASAAQRFFPSEATRWLTRNRRQVGLSFGVSHVIHYAAVAALAFGYPEHYFESEEQKLLDVTVWTTTLMLVAMMVTSFDWATRLLGPRAWKALHLLGVYFFWIAFASAFGGRALQDLDYVPVTLLLIAAMGLRLAATIARVRAR